VKIHTFSEKTRAALEETVNAFLAGKVTVHSTAYAIGPKGEREALLLYTEGVERQGNVVTAADRFIADALESGVSSPQVRSK